MIEVAELYRVKNWVKSLGICILGLSALNFAIASNPYMFLLGLAQTFLLFSFLYSLDDFNDYIVEGEKNFIGDLIKNSRISKKPAFALCILPLLLSIYIMVVNFSTNYFIFYIIFVVFSFLYSMPKVRLGDIPIVDAICNIIFFSCIFLLSYFFVNTIMTTKAYFFLIWISIYIFSLEILHQLAHFNKDKISTVKVLGRGKSLAVLKTSFFVSILIGIFFFIMAPELRVFSIVMSVFGSIRFLYVSKMNEKTHFEKFRNKMGGILEGGIYFALLAIGV